VPLTGDQLVTLALQDAHVPGFTTQAYQTLNMILNDLAQTYDFDVARGVYTFAFNTSLGSGPIPLPADYLRADNGEAFFTIQGTKYQMMSIELGDFDSLAQQQGLSSYPTVYATDLSLQNSTVPVMYVYPPPSGAYPVTIRYRRQMPDYVAGSNAVPWFPNQTYLRRRLAGEMMALTDDDRMSTYLGSDEDGAQGILLRYLKLKDDSSSRAVKVQLDRRTFGGGRGDLKNTKKLGF
jgi:hypothetical protein